MYYAVHIVRGHRHNTVEYPSVCPSVCPVDQQQQQRQAGLSLRSGASSRYQLIAAANARHAGRVNVDPTVKRSNIVVRSFVCSFVYSLICSFIYLCIYTFIYIFIY